MGITFARPLDFVSGAAGNGADIGNRSATRLPSHIGHRPFRSAYRHRWQRGAPARFARSIR
jgi:hypothetical protein